MPATVDASALLDGLAELGTRLGVRLGDAFVDTARTGVSRRTGELYDSIGADEPIVTPETVEIPVHASADHAGYQDAGTGIYGPEGTPIVPKRPGGVLVFDWPAAGGVVFARRVRGSEPTRFWQKALEAWPQIVRRISVGG